VDVDQVAYLVSPDGQRLLARASELGAANADDLAVAERLRRDGAEPAQVAAAITQVRLRARAAEKFGPDAGRLYFTPDGLEQATHGAVAALRASRAAAAGRQRVVDLCCGVGGDLLAFAGAGLAVTGVDRDPVAVAVATANLQSLGLDGEVLVGDAETYPADGHDTVFSDPARRGPAGRVFDPDHYSPPWSRIEDLVRAGAIAKVAPGIPHDLIPAGVEAEWVSVGGRLRETTLWPSSLAQCARRATVVRSGGEVASLSADEPAAEAPANDTWDRVGDYLYEPDDAVVRAHLVRPFAESVDGWLLDPHLAYVSANEHRATRLGTAYRVREALPFRDKALRAALRARDVGSLVIKKRGVSITPEQLRARLRLRGSESATIVLTRTPEGAQALLVERVDGVGPAAGQG
jgi:SAM-dependent methyltransferase